MKKKVLVALVATALLVSGCGYILKEIVAPNSCQRCEVVDSAGTVLDSYEGCGGDNRNLREQAEASAYSHMKSSFDCNIDVQCTCWKKDDDE